MRCGAVLQELGKEYIKYLKSSTAAVMSPFNLALCLSLARVQRMEGAVCNVKCMLPALREWANIHGLPSAKHSGFPTKCQLLADI
jgi:hypothetical protein